MRNDTKRIVDRFITEYKIAKADYDILADISDLLGYTVVEFNRRVNSKDVTTILNNLLLHDIILVSDGFTYADNEYRLIFINEDLSQKEKTIVISHELGHIVCNHLKSSVIAGNTVTDEAEANEFSHYLLHPSFFDRIKNYIIRHNEKFALGTVIAVVLIILAIIF